MAIPLANPLLKTTRASERATPEPWRAPAALRVWHLASLDAPTVAVVWALAFAWAARVHVAAWIVVMLFCGTFAVYVGDRLLDARRAIAGDDLGSLRERHYFHWRHRRVLTAVAICSAATACVLILRLMPPLAREHNSLVAVAALAYFSGVHSAIRIPGWLRRVGSKELLVALIFTAGCAAPSIWRSHLARLPMLVCFGFFCALAWLNCSAIDGWESRMRGKRVVLRSGFLAVAGVAASVACATFNLRISVLLLAASLTAGLLGVLDRRKNNVHCLALRVLADAVLLTPAIAVAIGTGHA